MTTDRMIVWEDANLLVQEGMYRDRDTLFDDAMRALMRSKPELRTTLAIALYKRKTVSLARAAEIAGLDHENFKECLREHGMRHQIEPVGEALRDEVAQLIQLRKEAA
ncbi:hypothetical protein U14_04797 [Candidatus Moduliflexus flocculans]|uniref:Uncharacterized protein n=1 Tax=Candidatus Moduliflexus flocculans TaxID=1499966 RepID=A0A0S6W544_9BACT|nr:hypothetical protein U14_04797 [Candidatus Moduliflexus flocculans]